MASESREVNWVGERKYSHTPPLHLLHFRSTCPQHGGQTGASCSFISCSHFYVSVLKFDVEKLTGCGRQSIQMNVWGPTEQGECDSEGWFFFLLMNFLVPHRKSFLITWRKLKYEWDNELHSLLYEWELRCLNLSILLLSGSYSHGMGL